NAISAPSTSPGFRIVPVSRRTGSPAGRSAGFCDGGPAVPNADLRGPLAVGRPDYFATALRKRRTLSAFFPQSMSVGKELLLLICTRTSPSTPRTSTPTLSPQDLQLMGKTASSRP